MIRNMENRIREDTLKKIHGLPFDKQAAYANNSDDGFYGAHGVF